MKLVSNPPPQKKIALETQELQDLGLILGVFLVEAMLKSYVQMVATMASNHPCASKQPI